VRQDREPTRLLCRWVETSNTSPNGTWASCVARPAAVTRSQATLKELNDCLRGGYGTPEDDDFTVEWHDHVCSRRALRYAETARQLEIRLKRCHPANRTSVAETLAAARAGEGATVFDWPVEIFEDQVPGALVLC
jgi:hypothetical protein